MGDLDEISRAIGRLEGAAKANGKQLTEHGEKIDRIELKLTAQKVKMAALSGSISSIMTILVLWAKHKFGSN